MKPFSYFFFCALILLSSPKVFSQCFQIESILVDACDTGTDEGFNEMVRFRVGSTAINTSNLSVNWPNNTWQGLVQNAATTAKVATLNTLITAAGGCGQLIQPIGGVLPANAEVILVSSYNFNTALNVFGAITENIYIIFQNNAATTAGHFANYNTTPGLRTLAVSFGSCSDAVTYERSLLVNINGTNGGSSALNDGSTVNFTTAGVASYVNNGCIAPVNVFEVNAGTTPITACPGSTLALSGTAQGQSSVNWTAPSGTFSSSAALSTNYTLDATATGSVILTLTAVNSCGQIKTSTVTVNIGSVVTPLFNPVPAICNGGMLAPLPITSINGISGVWSPALNNTATTTYLFTPNVGQCATTATLTIVVNSVLTPTFNPVAPICSGTVTAPLPTTSTNGIVGVWSPALNTSATTTYTFTPVAGQCATTTTLTVVVGIDVIPNFSQIDPICSGTTLVALPTTSLNGIIGVWSPAINNTATTTYTFTAVAGQCASITTMTITVNPAAALPIFTAVSPICIGGNLVPLPTTSDNEITGTWSPALNNMATTTYTFTPNAGQCATTTTLQISVQPGFDFAIIGRCVNADFVYSVVVVGGSFDLQAANFNWKNNAGFSIGDDSALLNVTQYLNSTPEAEPLPLTFSVTVTSAEGCVKSNSVVLKSISCDIQKGISPNNDTKNDFFDLELLGVKHLEIFNRYGTNVYSKSGYTNEWHGQSDKGEILPDGTYYYMIEFLDNQAAKTGWIYINK